MLVGYARVSTEGQSLDRQTDALEALGCERVYADHESGTREYRRELDRMLDELRRLNGRMVGRWLTWGPDARPSADRGGPSPSCSSRGQPTLIVASVGLMTSSARTN